MVKTVLKYYLGHNMWGLWEIIEHNPTREEMRGACIFDLSPHCISDADGVPGNFDSSYKEIGLDVRQKAMAFIDKISEELISMSEGKGHPVRNQLQAGDCIYHSGYNSFYKITDIREGRVFAHCLEFGYNEFYIYDDHEEDIVEGTDGTLDDFLEDAVIISNDIYSEAKATCKRILKECEAYLSSVYNT